MTLTIDGTATAAEIANLGKDIEAALNAEVLSTAAEIEAGVKLRMQRGPHTGRIYGKRRHRASAPGEAPAPDNGASGLLGSIYHQRDGHLAAVVGSRMAYAAYLEWGTRRMLPRPSWTPEVEQHRAAFRGRVAQIIAGAMK